jgi:hypothetical protein
MHPKSIAIRRNHEVIDLLRNCPIALFLIYYESFLKANYATIRISLAYLNDTPSSVILH